MKKIIYTLLIAALMASCEEVTTNDIICSISDLEVAIGDCNTDGTYTLTLNFNHHNAGNDFFDVYIRDNVSLGYFQLSDLPITIDNFEMSGYDYDYIQVCINDNANCCSVIEFEAPNCEEEEETNDCHISDLEVEIGDCNVNGTYTLTLNFNHDNTNNDFFDMYIRDNISLGYFQLSDLPITINNFEMSGYDYDYIQVCINDNPNCCSGIEFISPNCDE